MLHSGHLVNRNLAARFWTCLYNCSPCTHLALCFSVLRLVLACTTVAFAQSNDAVMQEALKPGTPIARKPASADRRNRRSRSRHAGVRESAAVGDRRVQTGGRGFGTHGRVHDSAVVDRGRHAGERGRAGGISRARRFGGMDCSGSTDDLHASSTSAWVRQRSSPRRETLPEPSSWYTAKY